MCHCWAGQPGSEKTTPQKEGAAFCPSTSRTRPSHGTSGATEPCVPQMAARSSSDIGTSQRWGERCTSSSYPFTLPSPIGRSPSAFITLAACARIRRLIERSRGSATRPRRTMNPASAIATGADIQTIVACGPRSPGGHARRLRKPAIPERQTRIRMNSSPSVSRLQLYA